MIKNCDMCGNEIDAQKSWKKYCVDCYIKRDKKNKHDSYIRRVVPLKVPIIRSCKLCGAEFRAVNKSVHCDDCAPRARNKYIADQHANDNIESLDKADNMGQLWTISDIEFIERNREKMTALEIAEALHRSYYAIMGVSGRNKIGLLTKDKMSHKVVSYSKIKRRAKKLRESRMKIDR